MKGSILYLISFALLLSACKKDPDLVPDNDAPYYSEVSDLLIENYIQRVYIDQIGREPFDSEMNSERLTLKAADLEFCS